MPAREIYETLRLRKVHFHGATYETWHFGKLLSIRYRKSVRLTGNLCLLEKNMPLHNYNTQPDTVNSFLLISPPLRFSLNVKIHQYNCSLYQKNLKRATGITCFPEHLSIQKQFPPEPTKCTTCMKLAVRPSKAGACFRHTHNWPFPANFDHSMETSSKYVHGRNEIKKKSRCTLAVS